MLPLEGLVSVRNYSFLQREVSPTFHGRDLFAPLAGRILSRADIAQFGPMPSQYKLLELPVPYDQGNDLVGEVIHVDHFGNLISNITEQDVKRHWSDVGSLQVNCNNRQVPFPAGTYALVQADSPLSLFNSSGHVELAVNQGRACDVFQAGLGAEIRIRETKFLDA